MNLYHKACEDLINGVHGSGACNALRYNNLNVFNFICYFEPSDKESRRWGCDPLYWLGRGRYGYDLDRTIAILLFEQIMKESP